MNRALERDIDRHFTRVGSGEPCVHCGSPFGDRIYFMARSAHVACVQKHVELRAFALDDKCKEKAWAFPPRREVE